MDKTDYLLTRINDPEISDDAYSFIFSQCDRVEYLNPTYGGRQIDVIEELYGTDLDNFIPAFIACQDDSSWGMEGKIYTFALTDEIKKLIKAHGISGTIKAPDGCTVFENATLYSDEKILYSCCSHEGYESFDDDFKAALAEVCRGSIEKADCFKNMLTVYERVKQDTKSQRAKEKRILRFTENYIKQEGNAPWYQKPPDVCTFSEFRRIAEKYLPTDIYTLLGKAKKFSDLHPSGYAQNLSEYRQSEKYKATDEENALLYGIDRCLFYLNYIENKFGDDTKSAEQSFDIVIVNSEPLHSEMIADIKTTLNKIDTK